MSDINMWMALERAMQQGGRVAQRLLIAHRTQFAEAKPKTSTPVGT